MSGERQDSEKKSLRLFTRRNPDWGEVAKDCVCFANAQGGRILVGVEDGETHPPPNQVVPRDLPERARKRIGELTVNVSAAVSIVAAANGGEVLEVRVSRSLAPASTTDGRYYARVADECKPLLGDDIQRLLNERSAQPWETLTVLGVPRSQVDAGKLASFGRGIRASDRVKPKDRPPLHANWLVDVRGTELAREEMIKLPINVKVKGGDDWRDCLREALELLDRLQAEAEALQANTARYLRPILLVQVERTGKDQREAGLIHAEDAREFLLTAGLAEPEIAVKTSEVNDLKEPENQDLLSPTSAVRVIITKQALQEGWDCPFAYVLCSLAAATNLGAMTQLVGRILRQPHAAKTGVPGLDECYVVCHHANTGDVVAAIKNGLEQDGMAELAAEIREGEDEGRGGSRSRPVRRRPELADVEIFLPVVNWVEGELVRPLDYEQDVLLGLDWRAVDVAPLADRIPREAHAARSQVTRVTVTDGADGEFFRADEATPVAELARFDPVYATRMIADIVPNPFVGRALVGQLMDRLRARGFDDEDLGAQSSFLIEELRAYLLKERDRLAERDFVANVAAERIQFRLRTDRHNWKMPAELQTDHAANARKLYRSDGNLPARGLFAPVYDADYNPDEAEFACYLDEQQALRWWHRNVAKAGQYHVQGWRKHKVYPDFVFALTRRDGAEKLVVLETKGDQLAGNLDTEYKRKLLRLMDESYRFQNVVRAGELELVLDPGTSVACDLVLMGEWRTRVPNEHFEA